MGREKEVSPYLKRPLRSLEEVLRTRTGRSPASQQRVEQAPAADNSNRSLPPARSA